jgi:hypothetical protein
LRTPRLYDIFSSRITYMKNLKKRYEEHMFHREGQGM